MLKCFAYTLLCYSLIVTAAEAKLRYLHAQPMTDVVKAEAKPWEGSSTSLKVPMIAWGGDIQTVLANGNSANTQSGSFFNQEGLKVQLYREDVFTRQVEAFLEGKTPFLRGTMGMLNMAAEVTNRSRATEMVVIYQLTWSAGGDALVVKDNIKSPQDLKGKTIAVQAFGPHLDYLTTVLSSAGLTPSDVNVRWMPDLFEVDAGSSSPAMALQQDASIDAALVIIPDALAITSGGNVGTGAEGSVRGARILLSTKTADRVISDVYAVRKDFYQKYPDIVEKFVLALLKAEEALREQMKTKGPELGQTLSASAKLLLDDSGAIEDITGMYHDAFFAGASGNLKFFNDPNYPRRFEKLNDEIQSAFIDLNLLGSPQNIAKSSINFDQLANRSGLETEVSKSKFNPNAVQTVVARKQQMDSLSEGELFSFEIYFQPNQNDFSAELYQSEFDRLIELASTYGGALLTIEGHSDPTGYLRKKKNGESAIILQRVKQSAKNLSYARANAVRGSVIDYAQQHGVTLDENQFGIVGHGVMKPNTPNASFDADGDLSIQSAPRTREEWNATRRVVFRLIQVEAESEVFEPLF